MALRTLRQRPKVVGTTPDGQTVFEVRSVRLVLRDDAHHFSRLVQCSRCGREVSGAPVLTQGDLDRPPSPVICKECVRVVLPMVESSRPPRTSAGAAPPVPPVPPEEAIEVAELVARAGAAESMEPGGEGGEAGADAAGAAAVDDVQRPDRLAMLEWQLRAVADRLAEVAGMVERSQADGQSASRMEAAASEMATRLDVVESRLRQGVKELVKKMEAQKADVAGVVTSLGELRAEMARLGASHGELARAQVELDRRVGQMPPVEAPPEGGAGLDPRVEGVQAEVAATHAEIERLHEDQRAAVQVLREQVVAVQAALAGEADARAIELGEALEQRLTQDRADAGTREDELKAGMARLEAMVSTLRDDLESSIQTAVQFEVTPIVREHGELANAHGRLEGRLAALFEAVEAGERRMHALEQGRPAPPARAPEPDDVDDAVPEPVVQSPPDPGSLLDSLEQQLAAAERRIARFIRR